MILHDFKIVFNLFFQHLFFLDVVYTWIYMHIYPYFIMAISFCHLLLQIGNYYCFYTTYNFALYVHNNKENR